MRYGMSVAMHVRAGQRDAVVAILTRDGDAMRALGCDLYLVGVSDEKPDVIYVTEVWTSRQAHRASLDHPAVQAAIAEAMPMLTGEFHSTEFDVVGGLGVPG
ncbi:putative quinol monooxygenase [Longimicrobium sp.]|uniref:putative quinol monooxygenase n=1 Tax=Longimicrobium sp. TaxID=2029185 RepID=UPI002E3304BE|nr:putative quinol monooxygenase [Longimicrobium sp.]HEX6040021.1 putative quinol monooxygenase [Longimicrobium sp.]